LLAVIGCSRFTQRAGFHVLMEVLRMVSVERSAENRVPSNSTTVKQHPSTAMLFAIARWGATVGASMVRRPPAGLSANESMVPRCSIIPVNIHPLARSAQMCGTSFTYKLRLKTRNLQPWSARCVRCVRCVRQALDEHLVWVEDVGRPRSWSEVVCVRP
jgi:hypothetical protein